MYNEIEISSTRLRLSTSGRPSLPNERPRLLMEPPGCKAVDLPCLLATVFIEPNTERVTLTWAGKMEVAAQFPEEVLKKVRYGAKFGSGSP